MASPYGLLKIDILVCDVLLVTSDDLHYIFMLQINRQQYNLVYGRLKAGESDDTNFSDCWLLNRLVLLYYCILHYCIILQILFYISIQDTTEIGSLLLWQVLSDKEEGRNLRCVTACRGVHGERKPVFCSEKNFKTFILSLLTFLSECLQLIVSVTAT